MCYNNKNTRLTKIKHHESLSPVGEEGPVEGVCVDHHVNHQPRDYVEHHKEAVESSIKHGVKWGAPP